MSSLRVGKTKRELAAIKRQITLLQHAVWLDVTRGGQGTTERADDSVRAMLMMDGWRPDQELAEKAGYFDLHRIMGGGIPGVIDGD